MVCLINNIKSAIWLYVTLYFLIGSLRSQLQWSFPFGLLSTSNSYEVLSLWVTLNLNGPSGAYMKLTLYSRGSCKYSSLYDLMSWNTAHVFKYTFFMHTDVLWRAKLVFPSRQTFSPGTSWHRTRKATKRKGAFCTPFHWCPSSSVRERNLQGH